jgi:PKD repeat protein
VKYAIISAGILAHLLSNGQTGLFINGDAAALKVNSEAFLSVNGDFANLNCDPVLQVRFNGPLYLAGNLQNNDTLKFNAVSSVQSKNARLIFRNSTSYPAGYSSTVSGIANPQLWATELNKPGGSVTLLNNILSADTLEFVAGHIYVNGSKVILRDPSGVPSVINHPFLKNERNNSKFLGTSVSDSGLVVYNTIYSSSVGLNPGNIGIVLEGLLDYGSKLEVRRGFRPQVNAGDGGICSYFDIFSPAYSLQNNTITVRYSAEDMQLYPPGFFNLAKVAAFVSPNTDIDWSAFPSLPQTTLVNNSSQNNGIVRIAMGLLTHPNVQLSGYSIRVSIADALCNAPPLSGLIGDTIHICAGKTYTLDAGNLTQVNNSTLKWEWNTATPTYERTLTTIPDNNYNKYKVDLKDVRGCITSDSVMIAPAAPYPQITYLNHLNSCLGDSVTIKDTVLLSSGNYSNQWSFSDGGSSTSLQNQFRKKFAITGTHSYMLTSTSNFGCAISDSVSNVIVYPLPTASFTSELDCVTGIVSFTNLSVSNHSAMVITSAAWNLGQGSTNTTTIFNPTQSYAVSGTYSVELISATNFGCSDTTISSVIMPPANYATLSKNNCCLGDTIYFNNISSCNTGSCIYTWYTGDGDTLVSFSVSKPYASTGVYSVKLKLSTVNGCPDSAQTTVAVHPLASAQFNNSATDACLNETVYMTNSSTVASGSIAGYQWDYGDGSSAATINGSRSYSTAAIYLITLTVSTDSGCISQAYSGVTVHPQPSAIHYVPAACAGESSLFSSFSNGNGLSHLWNFGNSIMSGPSNNYSISYTYPSAGNYSTSLIVTDQWNCSDTSIYLTQVLPSPVNVLSGSISTCGEFYMLNAGNPTGSYYWQPGNQSTQTITAVNSGSYWSVVSFSNGCTITQSVQLTLNSIVKPQLGKDTISCGLYRLNAGYPGSIFSWNTGATTQTIIVANTGSYAVTVTDINGCIGGDTIQVTVLPVPSIKLGADKISCKPKYGLVITPTVTGASEVIWSDNSSILVKNINSSGLYWLEGINADGCTKRDSIIIQFLATPSVNLGPDRSACAGILLDAQNNGFGYLWNGGQTSSTYFVSFTGNYNVSVIHPQSGCTQDDSVYITVHPAIKVTLGADTTVCSDSKFQLNADNPGAAYKWLSGQTTSMIAPSGTGVYGVSVIGQGGCSGTDYINVTIAQSPIVDLGPRIRYLCGTNPVELQFITDGFSTWGSSHGLSTSATSIQANLPGRYWLQVQKNGCSAADTILVSQTNNTISAIFLVSTRDTVNKSVQFVNLSKPVPLTQKWTFGDGITSTVFEPTHTYVLPNDFSVTLEVSNGFCSHKLTKSLFVLFREKNIIDDSRGGVLELISSSVFPNPAFEILNISCELSEEAPIHIQILDLTGKTITEYRTEPGITVNQRFQISSLSCGMYLISLDAQVLTGSVKKLFKFIKTD